jgi:2-keto-4-pentenoate hydratase/2-oxohepta-3-ene-1,7-dioic acid hydratase in catechol pathway
MTLEPGDLILTGTPEGVDQVKPGQVVEAGITNILESVRFPVIARPTAKL